MRAGKFTEWQEVETRFGPEGNGFARASSDLTAHTEGLPQNKASVVYRYSSIDELITTDTVSRPQIDGVKITTLSVAGLLGEAIKRIESNSSVSSLFEFKGGRTS